ncbi:uncharacterized protein LOC108983241 [Juglans regia]|uniref:Uncharacterized protein LOC108983241 n=2 Tax=Juglans regia TaxID=51240 RepID=A0A2I4DT96_JUGRE|nr:uncharacterized protein LOC108983241 [Juglans regia]XP_035545211.1 uncharacterized protein LOC108983241 [Juglans regia]
MIVEEHEIPNGWPLGLGTVNRLRVVESLPAAGVEPHSSHMQSASFSSLSSSNLDTESTASFFQDHSVTLGRLIGLRTGEKGGFYFQDSIGGFEEQENICKRDAQSEVSRGQRVDMSQGICIPLLLGALVKMSRSKSKARK